MIRQLIAFLLGIGFGIWEVAARPFLPAWAEGRPIIPVLVVVLVSSVRSRAFAFAIGAGLLVDAFAIGAPTIATLRWVVIAALLDVAARQFFTNRSLYAVIGMVVVARLLDWSTSFLVAFAVAWVLRSPYGTAAELHPWVILAWDVVLAGTGFLLIAAMTRRFLLGGRRVV